MSEYQSSDIRISDTEREDALGKLGEHMSEGRLDLDEYGERSAKVATAKTRGELLDLFGDLPEPKPAFGQPVPAVARALERRPRTLAERVAPVAVPVAAILVVGGLLVLLKVGFFVPLLFIFLFMNGRFRGGPGHRDRRGAMRERQPDMRDHYRGMGRRWRDDRG